MDLTDLIGELKESTQGREISLDEKEKIEGRVIFPENFDRVETEFKANFREHSTPLYYLLISGSQYKTLDEAQPILDELFRRSKGLNLLPGVAEVDYGVFWTPEAFREETKLPGLFLESKIRTRSSTYSPDTQRTRIGYPGKRHEIEAETQSYKLTIKAEGNYRKCLRELIDLVQPQLAKLNLTKEDAERLLKAVKSNPVSKHFAGSLERALQPKKMMGLSLDFGRGVQFGEIGQITLNVLTSRIKAYEDAIGMPLLDGSAGKSRVEELVKVYGLCGLLRGRRLHDLQTLTERISQVDLGLVYEHPLITNQQAREMLDKEIEIITDMYEGGIMAAFKYGMNIHIQRGGIVKRLAREHFGNDVVERFDEMNPQEYVKFLKSRGYNPINVEPEPEYIEKEMHLLAFFKQSYSKDQQQSVEKFRQCYVTPKPSAEIFAKSERDASRIRKIKLPEHARLFSFRVTTHSRSVTPYYNDLSISRILPAVDSVHFFSRTSIESPILIGLQEYVCKEMGISFK